MLHKTRGIIFQVTDFKETSVVAKIYTELFGLQGYIINSVRKKNSRVKQNTLHPLALVELVVYHKERKGLNRIAEIHPLPALQNIPFDIRKSSIALFLNEVLCKSIHEEESNPLLFEFIFQSIQLLDLQTPVNSDFHILFLLRLSQYLGFFPRSTPISVSPVPFFDLREGTFQPAIPIHPFYIEPPITEIFQKTLSVCFDFSFRLEITLSEKRILTEKILQYYKLHLPAFSEIRSRKVLEEVWGRY